MAARSIDSDQGQVLLLWLRQLPTYDDIKDLADGFSEEEFEDEDEDFEDDEDVDDEEDGEDDEDMGLVN